ncbi:MAG TPA: hypothetical protein VGL26_00190 [Jatrophihabitans sp.]
MSTDQESSTSRRTLLTGLAAFAAGGLGTSILAPEAAEAATSATKLASEIAAKYVSGFDISRYIKGNGKADDTVGFRRAIAAAITKGAKAILIPGGKRLLISAPVDLNGLSLIGYGATVLANPRTTPAKWKIPHAALANDVAVLYAIGHNAWSVVGLTIDCQNAFCKGLTAWGGDYITYLNVTVKNSPSAALQMMGSERAGVDKPIRFGRMIGCTVDRARWSFTLDGQHVGTQIVGCTSTNCLNSHISIDPSVARDAAKRASHGLVIVGNSLTGAIANPANWHTTGGANTNEAGIRMVNAPILATVSGNYMSNWPTVGIEAHHVGGTIVGNVVVNDSGRTGGTGIELRDNTALSLGPNQIINYAKGVDIDGSVTDSRILPQGFSNVSSRYVLASTLQPTVQIDDAAYRSPGGVFSTEPAALKAHRSNASQTISTDTQTPIVFDTESYDDMGIFDLAGAPDRVTIHRPGRYDFGITVTFEENANGHREVRLLDATTDTAVARAQMPGLAGTSTTVVLSTEIAVSAVPTVFQVQAFQNSGSDLAVLTQGFSAAIHVRKSA